MIIGDSFREKQSLYNNNPAKISSFVRILSNLARHEQINREYAFFFLNRDRKYLNFIEKTTKDMRVFFLVYQFVELKCILNFMKSQFVKRKKLIPICYKISSEF